MIDPTSATGVSAMDRITEPLAVDAKAAAKLFGLAERTWRRFDSSGRVPQGFKLGGRKLWRMSDLRLWAAQGFPDRSEFEAGGPKDGREKM